MSTFGLTSSSALGGVYSRFSDWITGLGRDSARGRDRLLLPLIRSQRESFLALNDQELVLASRQLRNDTLADHVSEAFIAKSFALYVEAVRRECGICLYDVQLLGGLSTLRREIAEMKTGEGKTFVGGLVAYAIGLRGRGAHFMTTNAYLAERDHALVLPIFKRLGLTVGIITREQGPSEKMMAYRCDATYGPGYEFGFDYLRDQINLLPSKAASSRPLGSRSRYSDDGAENESATQSLQTKHYAAIIDEADSVLIDEATTPLVLSGAMERPARAPEPYRAAQVIAQGLVVGVDFSVDHKRRATSLTQIGLDKIEINLDSHVRSTLRRPWKHYIENALQANSFLGRDQHYIVRDTKIMLVDGNTGRVFSDRTWSSGLHQAVEAKESVTITEENEALAKVSRQQYFRLYEHLCGMSGTVSEAKQELRAVYGLAVTPIQPHRACQRVVLPLRCFATAESKWKAIAACIREIHLTDRPVLVGTRTIEGSEIVASLLAGCSFSLLNGKQDADEAEMISLAGKHRAITIATNMAGRGTDIRLAPGVAELGGLHVIVTEPNDSARVDRQLVGRASRQGDPGSCQMFLSAEDRLVVQHAGWFARHIKKLAGLDGEVQVDLTHDLQQIQTRLERDSAATRQKMFNSERWQEDAKAAMVKA